MGLRGRETDFSPSPEEGGPRQVFRAPQSITLIAATGLGTPQWLLIGKT